jgi:iron complex transport system permease protein
MIVGPRFDRLLPTAMLLGASYLLIVDTLARSMNYRHQAAERL